MPKRRAFANLAAFYPALVDFANEDGTNIRKGRRFVSQARLASNVRCLAETIPVLYDAAEAAGLITTTRTPKGTVNGYALTFPLDDQPDWDAALDVLAGGMRWDERYRQLPGSSKSQRSPQLQGSSDRLTDQRSRQLHPQRSRQLHPKDPGSCGGDQVDHGLNHEGDAVVTSSYGDDDLAARRAAEIRAQIRRRARA